MELNTLTKKFNNIRAEYDNSHTDIMDIFEKLKDYKDLKNMSYVIKKRDEYGIQIESYVVTNQYPYYKNHGIHLFVNKGDTKF